MLHALFHTLPGRAVGAGAAVKVALLALRELAGGLPAWLEAVDTLATLAMAAGAAVVLLRGPALARRRLLWSVRRKLIISYIFVGLIPALLIVAFFLLGGLLLFTNFSSYLIQARLRSVIDRAESIARTTAVEIQRGGSREAAAIAEQRQAAAAHDMPGASLAVLPLSAPCVGGAPELPPAGAAAARAGPWTHVDPPAEVPLWIPCSGFAGLLAYGRSGPAAPADPGLQIAVDGQSPGDVVHLLIRAVAFPDAVRPAYAVIVDLPVGPSLQEDLRAETGVALTSVLGPTDRILAGRGDVPPGPPREAGANALPLNSAIFLDVRDWETGEPAGTFLALLQLSIAEIYGTISTAEGLVQNRSLGQGLLLALVLIGVLFLIIAVVALVTGLALARSIAGSVHALFAGTARVQQGDFSHRIAVAADDQLGELAGSFNEMTASIENLLRESAEKKRLEEELRIAHEIQMSLLPQGSLRMPGLSVTALCVPAREVGGDYYDFLPLDAHRVGLLIADVSGKGTSAALYMAELKGLVLSLSRIHTSPRELLIAANRIISEHLDARSFITMTYAVVDLEAGTMTYARAGHTPLIYLPGRPRGAAPEARILAPDGLVLGLKIDGGEMFERLLEEQTLSLSPGDLCLLFTDGITEAMNAGDDCFGEQRLARLIEAHAELPADELRERVLREIEAFVGGAPQHDDMTMILLRIEELAAAAPHEAGAAAEIGGPR